jgi:NADH-quinone oxidoreductase subunit L
MGELPLQVIAAVVCLLGIYLAYRWFLGKPSEADSLVRTPWGTAIHRFWFTGWGFDWLYEVLLVRPYEWIARINKNDFVDLIYAGTAWVTRAFHEALSATQTGLLRRYAMGITIGAVIALAIVMLL